MTGLALDFHQLKFLVLLDEFKNADLLILAFAGPVSDFSDFEISGLVGFISEIDQINVPAVLIELIDDVFPG